MKATIASWALAGVGADLLHLIRLPQGVKLVTAGGLADRAGQLLCLLTLRLCSAPNLACTSA